MPRPRKAFTPCVATPKCTHLIAEVARLHSRLAMRLKGVSTEIVASCRARAMADRIRQVQSGRWWRAVHDIAVELHASVYEIRERVVLSSGAGC